MLLDYMDFQVNYNFPDTAQTFAFSADFFSLFSSSYLCDI